MKKQPSVRLSHSSNNTNRSSASTSASNRAEPQRVPIPVRVGGGSGKKGCDLLDTVCPYYSAILIFLACTSIIWIIVGPWFVHAFPIKISIPVLVALGCTTILSAVNFLYASFMNPGYLPKALEDRYFGTQPSFVNIDGTKIQLKLCRTCHYYRMPRTVHCSQCDYCVDTFDHHCPWVNNCIGRRNYRNFFAFISTLTVHILASIAVCVTFLVFKPTELWNYTHITICVVTCITGIIAFPVGGLMCFHIFLIYSGLTTYEHVSNKYTDNNSPFDMGPCSNCAFQLCGPEFPIFEPVMSHGPDGEGSNAISPSMDEDAARQVQQALVAKFVRQAITPHVKFMMKQEEPMKKLKKAIDSLSLQNHPQIVEAETMEEENDNKNSISFIGDDEIVRMFNVAFSQSQSENNLDLDLENVAAGDSMRWEEATGVILGVNSDIKEGNGDPEGNQMCASSHH